MGYVAGSAWESASAGATQAIDVMTLAVTAIMVAVVAVWAAKRAIPAIKNAVRSEGAE